jgi:hypothetical protein
MALAVKNGWSISFQQVNPKRPDTKSWQRYEAYKHCTTAEAALECGCLRADLEWDWKRGFVEVFDPALLQGRAEPGLIADVSQGLRYAEWDVAKLVLLPKKGDL